MKRALFLKKLVACITASLTTSALLLVIGNSGTLPWFPPVVVFSFVGLCFLAALIFPIFWHYREKRQISNSRFTYSAINAIISYSIAFNLATFGWKKIMGLQFIVPGDIADKPMNLQSGEWLTWYYFGYSYNYGLIIALIQIVGSYLLLFRRTWLLGTIILLAFMTNLTLINIFYQMNLGALIQSLFLTMGLIYLVSLEKQRIIKFLFESTGNLGQINLTNSKIKIGIRYFVIILSFLFVLYLKSLI